MTFLSLSSREVPLPAWVTTVLDLLAAGLIVAGVAMIFVPAAFIVAGVLVGWISWQAAA